MCHFKSSRFGGPVVVVLLSATAAAFGQSAAGPDPVERIAEVLRQDRLSPAVREQQLRQCLQELHAPGELYRAWGLSSWRDARSGDGIAAVDLVCRRQIAERFLQEAAAGLRSEDPVAAAATADWLAQLGAEALSAGERPTLLRRLGPPLAELVRRNDPAAQAAAARALGTVEPGPAVAVPAFNVLLRSPDPVLRRAAAAGLAGLLPAALQSVARVSGTKGPRDDLAATAAAVVPVARRALEDPDAQVRRQAMGALRLAASALGRLVAATPPVDVTADDHDGPRCLSLTQVQPLVERLRDQGPALASAVRDEDNEVRLLACKGIEDLAEARWRLLRWAGRPAAGATADRHDPLRLPLQAVLAGLAGAAGDDDVRVRRAALDALEIIGPDAASAVAALTRALQDPDRFVRRSAVRVLGGLGPVVARDAVTLLTPLLDDQDPDLALAALLALQRIVPGASPVPGMLSAQDAALPAILRSLHSRDVLMRVAVLQTLRALDASPAVPAVCEVLADPDARVRKAAAEALGALGPAAGAAAVDPLRHALADASPEVREAAREALLAIRRPTQR